MVTKEILGESHKTSQLRLFIEPTPNICWSNNASLHRASMEWFIVYSDYFCQINQI